MMMMMMMMMIRPSIHDHIQHPSYTSYFPLLQLLKTKMGEIRGIIKPGIFSPPLNFNIENFSQKIEYLVLFTQEKRKIPKFFMEKRTNFVGKKTLIHDWHQSIHPSSHDG